MKQLIGVLLLWACSSGCIFEGGEGPRHHGREAIVEVGHVHCENCGHVHVGGVWYNRD